MTNNSFVHLRGIKVPINVSKAQADTLASYVDDKNVSSDTIIHIGNFHFKKSEVRFIESNSDVNYEKSEKNYEKENSERRQRRIKFCRLSSEEKSNDLEMFKLLYRCSTGDLPSEETLKSAYIIQLRFFREHKSRALCDPALFRPIIPLTNKKLSPFVSGGFRFIEKTIHHDMSEAINYPVF